MKGEHVRGSFVNGRVSSLGLALLVYETRPRVGCSPLLATWAGPESPIRPGQRARRCNPNLDPSGEADEVAPGRSLAEAARRGWTLGCPMSSAGRSPPEQENIVSCILCHHSRAHARGVCAQTHDSACVAGAPARAGGHCLLHSAGLAAGASSAAAAPRRWRWGSPHMSRTSSASPAPPSPAPGFKEP